MTSSGARTMACLQSVPSLPKHVHIRYDPLRQAFAVLSPERVFWPNDISLDILRRCDGRTDVGHIVADLAAEYDAPATAVADDVVAFLQEWSDRLLVRLLRQPEILDPAAGTMPGFEVQQPLMRVGKDVSLFERGPLLPPIGMLAELTHRCPLQCPYCSNPTELLKANRELPTETWLDLFRQAADLGVMQVHLSGGEPTLRRDLEQLIAGLSARGVYTNLITAGIGIAEGRIAAFAEAGLDHLQLSFQGARPATTDRIGNHRGSHDKKIETARQARATGLPLTINAPIHRHNIEEVPEFIEMALSLGAERLEIANVQYAGWALANRHWLMPDRAAVDRQAEYVRAAKENLTGVMNIDYVPPDYFATYPKPCMGGWARDAFVVTPDGTVLPCHAAQTIRSLNFERFGPHKLAEIWTDSAAFNAFRGTDWMQEPCRSCERREIDWGGCRCQAMAIAGDAAATDPACIKSPLHAQMAKLVEATCDAVSSGDEREQEKFAWRRIGADIQGSAPSPDGFSKATLPVSGSH